MTEMTCQSDRYVMLHEAAGDKKYVTSEAEFSLSG